MCISLVLENSLFVCIPVSWKTPYLCVFPLFSDIKVYYTIGCINITHVDIKHCTVTQETILRNYVQRIRLQMPYVMTSFRVNCDDVV